jgi:hypothetical protein
MAKSTIEAAVNELTKLTESNRDIEPKLRLGLTQIGVGMKSIAPSLSQAKSPTIVTPRSERSSGSSKSIGSAGSRGSVGSRGSTSSKKSKASIHTVQFPG